MSNVLLEFRSVYSSLQHTKVFSTAPLAQAIDKALDKGDLGLESSICDAVLACEALSNVLEDEYSVKLAILRALQRCVLSRLLFDEQIALKARNADNVNMSTGLLTASTHIPLSTGASTVASSFSNVFRPDSDFAGSSSSATDTAENDDDGVDVDSLVMKACYSASSLARLATADGAHGDFGAGGAGEEGEEKEEEGESDVVKVAGTSASLRQALLARSLDVTAISQLWDSRSLGSAAAVDGGGRGGSHAAVTSIVSACRETLALFNGDVVTAPITALCSTSVSSASSSSSSASTSPPSSQTISLYVYVFGGGPGPSTKPVMARGDSGT